MGIMDQKKLCKILKRHEKWVENANKGQCANLSYADLRGLDLRGANLSYAELDNADLRDANLENANLCGAYLYNANLEYAILCGADLGGADLNYANLSHANLKGANLKKTDLLGAQLNGATLEGAVMENTELSYADLSYAKLQRVNLESVKFRNTNLSCAYIDDSIVSINRLGEDNEMLTYNITLDIVWHENFSGTLEDFMSKLEINHPDKRSMVRREYDKAVSFLKDMKKIYKKHKNALTL